MKGFYITVKNGLLDPKHYKAMHASKSGCIWLFLWLLDKMTIINHEIGEGKVLGGKPIKYEEISKNLGISRATYKRWINILKDGNYISTIRTPYGLTITIHKAFKVFGQKVRDGSDMSHRSDGSLLTHHPPRSEPSNKTIQYDKTVLPIKSEHKTPAEEARSFFEQGTIYQEIFDIMIAKIPKNIVERELLKFVLYWTERTKSGKQQRWELQKTFEVKRRLGTWFRKLAEIQSERSQIANKYKVKMV